MRMSGHSPFFVKTALGNHRTRAGAAHRKVRKNPECVILGEAKDPFQLPSGPLFARNIQLSVVSVTNPSDKNGPISSNPVSREFECVRHFYGLATQPSDHKQAR
jgi:hypothetical protein